MVLDLLALYWSDDGWCDDRTLLFGLGKLIALLLEKAGSNFLERDTRSRVAGFGWDAAVELLSFFFHSDIGYLVSNCIILNNFLYFYQRLSGSH